MHRILHGVNDSTMNKWFVQILPPEQDRLIEQIIRGGMYGIGALAFIGVLILILKAFLYIAKPSEVLIFSGLKRRGSDGELRSFRSVVGGRGFRVPILEKVDRMSLELMEIPITIRNAYSKGGIPLTVDAIANVKVSSDETIIANAIERFLGRDPNELRRVAKETMEGHLRGVLATLTPEEVNEDRLAFGEALTKESEEDLRKLGLHVDTVKIQHVSDDVHYLDSSGRAAIAQIVRSAEIAESNYKRAAEQAEAESRGLAEVALANAQANVAKMQNDLRKTKADLESKVKSEEERTLAMAREARAQAEQELQRIRAKLSAIQQQADVVLPAEANRRAAEYQAAGAAALTRERGRAVSESLGMMNEAWKLAGDQALQIALIEDLEKLISAAADGVTKVKVNQVHMIGSTDSHMLQNYVKGYGESLTAVLDMVSKTTGIDITKTISKEEPR